MRRTFPFACALLGLGLGACVTAGDGNSTTAELVLVDEQGDVRTGSPTIVGVSVRDRINVNVTIGTPTTPPTLTGDSNLFDAVDALLDNEGYLVVRAPNFDPEVRPVLELTVADLESVAVFGEEAEGTVTGLMRPDDAFGLGASEGATVTVDGECGDLRIITSAGDVDASALACARGVIDAQGGSDVRAQLSEAVTVTASGESVITVTGGPADVTEALTDNSVLNVE